MGRRRTEAAARASRTNGARSSGPNSASGKAVSARNARKHGLFASTVVDASTLCPADIELFDYLLSLGADTWEGWRLTGEALQALVRLGRVTVLIELATKEIDLLLAKRPLSMPLFIERVGELVRFARYERRFRGRLDRTIRALTKLDSDREAKGLAC
jgi:hypothetical protein